MNNSLALRGGAPARLGRLVGVLVAPLAVARRHWPLIRRIGRREIEQRYRGSVLGPTWALLSPLLMLAVYTFVFSKVFQSQWGQGAQQAPFSLLLFCGLIVFGVFADSLNRAPGLMLENTSYIKKVVFPLDTLAWTVLFSAVVNAGFSLAIWLLFHLVMVGLPPWTILLLPIVLAPLVLMTLGATWFLAALGVYVRDLRQIVPVITTVLMFVSPVFYPRTAAPPRFEAVMACNPLAAALEGSRDLMIYGQLPAVSQLVWLWGGAVLVFVAGHVVFGRLRVGFADVL